MSWPKTFFKSKYILLGTLKKNFSSIRPWQHPSTSANIFRARGKSCNFRILEMLAEVLGCCQGLSELKIFLRVPNNIYFDLKKVLGSQSIKKNFKNLDKCQIGGREVKSNPNFLWIKNLDMILKGRQALEKSPNFFTSKSLPKRSNTR